MPRTYSQALSRAFLGNAPGWYKWTILGFLAANPLLLALFGPFVTGWALIAQFIFTLAMALKCYPLPCGGLLALEAVLLGMTSPDTVYAEVLHNFPVILLLMFMVAGIYFMKELLQYSFTRILLGIRSKALLSLVFCLAGAVLSAFLDALTVTAVIITVAHGFYNIYHGYVSTAGQREEGKGSETLPLAESLAQDLEQFRGFLRNLMMHGAVGTALGGVTTLVGEPQNLLIGHEMGWHFMDFFVAMAPVTLPVLAVGLATCLLVERLGVFGYGYGLPENVRKILLARATEDAASMGPGAKLRLGIQALAAVLLVLALALHVAEVGLIGLGIIVLLTACCGITDEHQIGHAFQEAMPFTALLVVFFSVVAVIHDQHLFAPIIGHVLTLQGKTQLAAYYMANGALSAISDNVFVATVYISETKRHFVTQLGALPGVTDGAALLASLINKDAAALAQLPAATQEAAHRLLAQFSQLAVAINTGTNVPSVATPNGQAAFLFLLTSALAPVIRLSYMEMVRLALPYTVSMSCSGLAAVWFLL